VRAGIKSGRSPQQQIQHRVGDVVSGGEEFLREERIAFRAGGDRVRDRAVNPAREQVDHLVPRQRFQVKHRR
jgi:hypothetical protein